MIFIFNDQDFDVSVFFFWGLWIGEKSLVLEQVFVSVKTQIHDAAVMISF